MSQHLSKEFIMPIKSVHIDPTIMSRLLEAASAGKCCAIKCGLCGHCKSCVSIKSVE